MNATLIGHLEFEPIRKAFPKEAHAFTTWLEEHIDVLADRLGLQLTVVQREKAVGAFNEALLQHLAELQQLDLHGLRQVRRYLRLRHTHGVRPH